MCAARGRSRCADFQAVEVGYSFCRLLRLFARAQRSFGSTPPFTIKLSSGEVVAKWRRSGGEVAAEWWRSGGEVATDS
jgi:hypothetical protein